MTTAAAGIFLFLRGLPGPHLCTCVFPICNAPAVHEARPFFPAENVRLAFHKEGREFEASGNAPSVLFLSFSLICKLFPERLLKFPFVILARFRYNVLTACGVSA